MYYSISVSSIVCLVSKRGSNQQNAVMSKLAATSPWSKVKTAKKSFRTIDRSLHDWGLAGRLGHNPPESHHRPIPPKLREISSVGRDGTTRPGTELPFYHLEPSLKSLKLQTKLKKTYEIILCLSVKNSCKVPHLEIVDTIAGQTMFDCLSVLRDGKPKPRMKQEELHSTSGT